MCKTKDELNKLVARKRKLSALKKKLDAQLKDVDNDIIEYVVAKGEKGGKNDNSLIVFGDGYKVSYITTISHPLDNDKIKALLGDRIAEYQTTKSSNKLDVR